MNFGELKSLLRKQVGNPSTVDVSDTDLGDAINFAYSDIATNYRHHNSRRLARFNTAIGSAKYTLPTDCGVLISVRNVTQNLPVRKYENDAVLNLDAPTTGSPLFYDRKIDYMHFYPTPDAVEIIEMYYNTIVAKLVQPTDAPLLLEPWHIGIVKKARWYHFDGVRQYNEAALADQSFNLWLNTKTSEFDQEKMLGGDFGVNIIALSESSPARLDFNHAD